MSNFFFTFLLPVIVVIAIFGTAAIFAPKGWRTIVAHVIGGLPVGVAAFLQTFQGFDWHTILSDAQATWAAVAYLGCTMYMRIVTTTAVGEKTAP